MKQISVFLENKKGRLKEVTSALAKEGVGIKAVVLSESIEFGVLKIITDNIAKAVEAIEKNGFSLTLTDILVVEIEDETGTFNKVVSLFSDNGIEIEYCYTISSEKGAFAFKVDKLSLAKEILSKHSLRFQ